MNFTELASVCGNQIERCTFGFWLRDFGAIRGPGKHPRVTDWQSKATTDLPTIEAWLQRWPKSNLGIRLGPKSNVVDVEFDCSEGAEAAGELLGDIATPAFKSDRSTHRLFLFPHGIEIPKAVVTARGLEMRFGTDARGAQSVFPPSMHASGVEYAWLPGRSPDDIPIATFPNCLVELMMAPDSDAELTFKMTDGETNDIGRHPGVSEGSRNQTLCRLVGGHLKSNGPDSKLAALAIAWAGRCSPPMPQDEALRVVVRLSGKEFSKGVPAKSLAVAKPSMSIASRRYSEVETQTVEWLWRDRIALGKITLLCGEPGLGKTTLAIEIASRISNSEPYPDGSMPTVGEVAILTAEDGAEDTLKPRLVAAGANVERIHHIDAIKAGDKELWLNLGEHLPVIERWLDDYREVRLLVLDPISAFFGNADTHRNSEVRSILGPFAKLCESRRIAVLGITHLTDSYFSQWCRHSVLGGSWHRINGTTSCRHCGGFYEKLMAEFDKADINAKSPEAATPRLF